MKVSITARVQGEGWSSQHDVHVLVTRHGISCANLLEVRKPRIYRGTMSDPLLTSSGMRISKDAGVQVAEWLKARNLTLDAVFSSELARALETAALMYPNQGRPVYAAPYIRDYTLMGKSNQPEPPTDQVKKLVNAFGAQPTTNLKLNYHWTNTFGHEPGSWDQFLFVLEKRILPELIEDLQKPPGSPIVLAVVTHSNFIAKSLGQGCVHLYEKRGYTKPPNNQVVHVTYKFTAKVPPVENVPDATPKYKLTDVRTPCEEVAPGMAEDDLYQKETMCVTDIGDACLATMRVDYAGPLSEVLKQTIEREIEMLAKKIYNTLKTISSLPPSETRKSNLNKQIRLIHNEMLKLKSATCRSGNKPSSELYAAIRPRTSDTGITEITLEGWKPPT